MNNSPLMGVLKSFGYGTCHFRGRPSRQPLTRHQIGESYPLDKVFYQKWNAFMLTDITMTARFADSTIDRRTSTDIDPQDVHNAVSECDPAWYRRG